MQIPWADYHGVTVFALTKTLARNTERSSLRRYMYIIHTYAN